MVKASPFIHQPDLLARKASKVSEADWRYQTHVKKYDIISRVLFRFFQGWKSLFDTVVNMVKPIYFEKLERSLNYKH